jgi:uncharacterized membrane protein YhaH (DUF805 family)
MNPLTIFAAGAMGSLAVEVVHAYQAMQSEPYELPGRYRRPAFWVVRLMLALIAGGLALAYGIQDYLLAANVGAATPLIIQAFAQGIQPPNTVLPPVESREPLHRGA